HPALTAAAALGLTVLTTVVILAFLGKFPPAPRGAGRAGAVFYVVAYHYGYAFYDRNFSEVEAMEVKEGEPVTLYIVPSQALPREVALEYAERTLAAPIGGLAPGDPRIRQKILEDFALGNVEHIIGISGLPVYVTTNVTAALNGRPFREGGPPTLREAVERGDPTIKTVTFTAKRVGAFDVLCVDSGMDGAGTCGWGHKWMVAKGAFIVRR
ncbi:MAG: hypothetical protein HY725_00730, partial [Candidatus Rokubacteria bacterium]|nr:hypothetical protein [Candidatus Rokubacteria bacterium]